MKVFRILLLLTTSMAFSSMEYNALEEGVTEQLTAKEIAEIKPLGGNLPSLFARITYPTPKPVQAAKDYPTGRRNPGSGLGFRFPSVVSCFCVMP